MQTDTRISSLERRTGGLWTHTGRLTVHFQLEDGTQASVTLPDDWVALQTRVTALEARTLEDMHYGH
jgi:hypothetical protein